MKNKTFLILMFFSKLLISCSFNMEEQDIPFDSASFKDKSITLMVGEEKQVLFDIKPKSSVPLLSVSYSVTSPVKVIEVSEETSNGCVIKGLEQGNCVLVGKCNGLTSYVTINVIGNTKVEPYIVLNEVSIEMNKGDNKAFTASLYGGSVKDNALFSFTSSDTDIVTIEESNNTCFLKAHKKGFSKITVSHPKALYDSAVLCFVNEDVASSSVYITTSQNVMQLSIDEGTKTFSVSLVGKEKANNSLFTYKVSEGSENINVIKNNNYFNVTPLKEGSSIIEISHPDSLYPIQVQIVCVKTFINSYIQSDNNFLSLKVGDIEKVNCYVVGNKEIVANFKFSYIVQGDSCVVNQVDNSFIVEAVKKGKTKVIVSNELCNENLELLFIVSDVNSQRLEQYITTSQNVIKMEEGEDETLNVLLTNSNLSDKNLFSFEIDDKSIIDVRTSSGTVRSIRSVENINGTALIHGLKEGIATIKITHPKSLNPLSVIVRVYPKGTLTKYPILSGKPIVRVEKGKEEIYTASYSLNNSSSFNINDIIWKSEDSNIITVQGKGLTCVIKGIDKGVTRLSANSKEMENPFYVTVVCGTKDEIDKINALYVDNLYHNLYKGENLFIEVKSNNPNLDTRGITVSTQDPSILKANIVNNILVIEAKEKGYCEVTISHSEVSKPLTLFIKVMDEVTIDKPYFFTYDSFISVVVGESKEVKVKLNKCDDVSDISYFVDSDVISIDGNADCVMVKALKEGVAEIRVSHPKVSKDGIITVYTANTIEELNNKIVLKSDKQNYLILENEDILLKCNVNNPSINKDKIKWKCSDLSLCEITPFNDSCLLHSLNKGNCIVEAYIDDTSLPFFISIKEKESELYEKSISLPLILELNKDMGKTIKAFVNNLTQSEKEDLSWSVNQANVIDISYKEEICHVKAINEGSCKLKIESKALGLSSICEINVSKKGDKDIVMALPSSFYDLSKGDELKVTLVYGKNKPSIRQEQSITWEVEDNSVIEIIGNQRSCSIKAKDEGVTKVNVQSPYIKNTLTFTVTVSSFSPFFYIKGDEIKVLKTLDSDILTFSLFDNKGNKVKSDFTYSLSKEDIISVTQNEDSFYIKALKSGDVTITLRSKKASKDYKCAIFVRDTDKEISELKPLTTTKSHYLIAIGESATLNASLLNDSYINDLVWSVRDASICSYKGSGKTISIKGKKEGSTVFTCSTKDKKSSVSFYVYVTSFNNNVTKGEIWTPYFISFVSGEEVSTSIKTSLREEDNNLLIWTSNSDNLVIDGRGTTCSLTSKVQGLYEVTVKLNSKIYRTIVVYVAKDKEDKDRVTLINNDKRYYTIGKGEVFTLKPFFNNEEKVKAKTTYKVGFDNFCVSYKNNNGVLEIEGLNEGITSFTVTNPDCLNSYTVYFEVQNKSSEVSGVKQGYLTTTKTSYFLDYSKPLDAVVINVNGVDIKEENYKDIKYTLSDPSIATVIKDNNKCYLYPNKEGKAVLKVSSIYSYNTLELLIVVGKEDVIKTPFIKPSTDNVSLTVGEEKWITYTIENPPSSFDKSNVKVSVKNNLCEAFVVDGKVLIKGKKSGCDIITLDSGDKEIGSVNIVATIKGKEGEVIYLTTQNNFSLIKKGSFTVLNVDVVNYNENDPSSYSWSVTEGEDIVSIKASGKSAIVTGLKEGVARLKVVHNNGNSLTSSLYPLYITIKVIEDTSSSYPYITTENNVINTYVGEKTKVSFKLINGKKGEENLFCYSSSNNDCVSVMAAQNDCLISSLKEGTSRITVSHPSSLSTIDIIVIVNAKKDEEGIYIQSDSTVIEMSPNDTHKTLNVSLVGGKESYNSLFSYNVINESSTIKNKDGTSNKVIEVIGSGKEALIKPLNEGKATIRVSNSATTNFLDVKVIVSLYSSLSFSTSNITIEEGSSSFIDVKTPMGKTVIYESDNENIAIASGTSKKCIVEALKVEEGKTSSIVVIKARTTDGTCKDELLVKVTKSKKGNTNYITTSHNVLSLNSLSDNKGVKVSASLNGTNIDKSESENIKWTLNTDIVSFSSTSLSSINAKDVVIRPEKEGEGTIVLTHPLTKQSKVIYVTVENSYGTLSLSENVVTLPLDSVYSLSATLNGIDKKEEENIIWKTLDKGVIQVLSSNGETVKGSICNIKVLKEGEARISCSYGNIIKYVNIFVKVEPSLSLPITSAKLPLNEKNVKYKVEVYPKSLYENVVIESSSSLYANVSKEIDKEKQECYINVSTTGVEGKTEISVKLKNITRCFTLTTSNDVAIKLTKMEVYDKKGLVTKTVLNPTSIESPLSVGFVRVYYESEMSSLSFDNKEKEYSMFDLSLPKFTSSTSPFIKLSFGKDYFDITPLSTGYATLSLIDSSHKGVKIDVPLCFTVIEETKIKGVSQNKKSFIDNDNFILNIANEDTISFSLLEEDEKVCYKIKTETNPINKDSFFVNVVDNKVLVTGKGFTKEANGILQSTEYVGTFTITVIKPLFNNVCKSEKYTYIVNQEIWK